MSTVFSRVSDESSSEGTPLREFVNETIAQDQQPKTKVPPSSHGHSPRQAVLSQTSLRHPLPQDDSDPAANSSRHSRRSVAERRKRERDLVKANSSQRELVSLLVDQEMEAAKLRKALRLAIHRVDAEARRISELEQANDAAAKRQRQLAESRLAAEEEATKAKQELKVYSVKLENVQQDAERVSDALKQTEKERDDAERAAARAREKARELRQQQVLSSAKEEGRRMGFEAGFEHARRERLAAAQRQQALQQRQMQDQLVRTHDDEERTTVRTDSRRSRTTTGHSRAHTRTRSSESQPQRHERRHPTESGHRPRRPPVDVPEDAEEDEEDHLHEPYHREPDVSRLPHPVGLGRYTATGTPLHGYRPPPADEPASRPPPSVNLPRTPSYISHSLPAIAQPAPPTIQNQPPPPRAKSPSIHVYPLVIPTTEQLAKEFPSNEQYGDHPISTKPGTQWAPASQFQKPGSSSSPAKAPPNSQHPPNGPAPTFPVPQLPPPQFPVPQLPVPVPAPGPSSAPVVPAGPPPPKPLGRIMSKTKKQAVSWYRSLSFRKKNKPVIDPDEGPGATPTTDDPFAGPSLVDKGKQREDYFGPPPPGHSLWYRGKHLSGSVAPSMRSKRAVSDVASISTKISQYDLLSTPNPSGMDAPRKVRENILSAIREDPASRNATPSADRLWGATGYARPGSRMSAYGHARSASSPTPGTSGPLPPQLYSQPSRGTLRSQVTAGPSVAGRRRAKGMSINISPDDDARYHAPVPIVRPDANISLVSLHRQPSSRKSPNTAIGIDVIPPSSMQPYFGPEPPNTGNHLSPYHALNPPRLSQLVIPTNQSVTSFKSNRTAGPGPSHGPTPHGGTGSTAGRIDDQRSMRSGIGAKTPRSTHSRPEDGRSAPRKKSTLQLHVPEPPLRAVTPRSHSPNSVRPPLNRATSNTSLRDQGSFGQYNPIQEPDLALSGAYGPPRGAPNSLALQEYYNGPIRRMSSNDSGFSKDSGLSYQSHSPAG